MTGQWTRQSRPSATVYHIFLTNYIHARNVVWITWRALGFNTSCNLLRRYPVLLPLGVYLTLGSIISCRPGSIVPSQLFIILYYINWATRAIALTVPNTQVPLYWTLRGGRTIHFSVPLIYIYLHTPSFLGSYVFVHVCMSVYLYPCFCWVSAWSVDRKHSRK